MKKIITLLFGMAAFFAANAQTEWDALRYSQNQYFGTARFSSMGGAFGALGGDLSSIAINPAGAGVYKNGEFSFTNAWHNSSTTSTYLSRKGDDGTIGYAFQQIGLVGCYKVSSSHTGLLNINLGITYNKNNDFTFKSLVRGLSSTSSMMDYFSARVNANSQGTSRALTDFESILAYKGGAVYYHADDSTYYSSINQGDRVNQKRSIDRSGYIGTYDFSISGNISNMVYFGASLGSVSLDYTETQLHSEDVVGISGNTSNFTRFDYRNRYYARGNGLNGKFGVIIRPLTETGIPVIENLRIAAAIHTPTYFTIEDRVSGKINSSFSNEGDYNSETLNTDWYRYKVKTPMKVNLGAAINFGNQLSFERGILSVDYEFIDYSSIKMDAADYYFDEENDNIRAYFKATHNLRVGGEYQVGPWSFRAGYSYYGAPLKSEAPVYTTAEAPFLSSWSWSTGIGYRSKNAFYTDFAYSRSYSETNSRLYIWNENIISDIVNSKNTLGSFVWTMGWKF